MVQDDFKLDTTFTDPRRNWVKPAAIVAAIVLVSGLILTMTTDLATRILPMSDNYLDALVPRAPDNAEPLALKTLEQEITGNVLTVRGTVENRTEFNISGVAAVIQPLDIQGLSQMPIEVPVQPGEVPTHGAGTFEGTVTLNDRPSGYSIKFRLLDGPFVPHKDERAPTALTP